MLARAAAEAQAFVSLLAHELRTRLKVTELALATGDEDSMETARANTRSVQGLVEDLLELARGDRTGTADANVAFANVVDELRSEGRLDAEVILSGELPSVQLPLRLLETILRNLIVNAIEAGASTVEVFARPDRSIGVRDDGPGVSPRNAHRIFGVYSGKFGGAGLGLMLVREILHGRGGDIWLELPSTFVFRV
jgi:signal transduction histidine kinase